MKDDKISTQRRFNSTVSRETYKHGRHSFLTPRALLLSAHARANDMNYRGTVRTPTCNKNYSFSSEHTALTRLNVCYFNCPFIGQKINEQITGICSYNTERISLNNNAPQIFKGSKTR